MLTQMNSCPPVRKHDFAVELEEGYIGMAVGRLDMFDGLEFLLRSMKPERLFFCVLSAQQFARNDAFTAVLTRSARRLNDRSPSVQSNRCWVLG